MRAVREYGTKLNHENRHTEEQIIQTIKEHQAGLPSTNSVGDTGSSKPPFYMWRQKFGGLEVNEAKHLSLIEDENRKLNKFVANQALDMMV